MPNAPEADAGRRPRTEFLPLRRDRALTYTATTSPLQVAPAANTDTDLYTVPKQHTATVRVYVCERGGAAATFRIAIRRDGATIDNIHYVAYGAPLAANEDAHTEVFDCLGEDDVVTVRASTADCSFSAVGREEPRKGASA